MTGGAEIARPARRARRSVLMRGLLRLGDRLETGRLTVTLPDGDRRVFGGGRPGPEAALDVHDERVGRRFLIGGNLGFCESYIDGDWSSPDIDALFVFFLLNEERLGDAMMGRPWFRALQQVLRLRRPNNRRGARRNIASHYDLGNDFYAAWLDPSMTYSSAIFPTPDAPLEVAQRAKYAALARLIGLEAGHHVLEIGCGWGGFAEFAAAEVGARVTAITISREQHAFAAARMARCGLADRVEVRLQDYRETTGAFDRIASIEMVEAVGESWWPTYFRTVRDRLVPGGVAGLQAITIADRYFEAYRHGADYIQKYIFPGGMLPSPGVLEMQTARAGMTLRGMVGYGADYARTLRRWNARFQAAWPEIERMGFDRRFKRMWEQYLAYCAAGFEVGSIDVQQFALVRD